MEQSQHHNSPFNPRSFPLAVITDGVQSPANLGGLLRLMEAFGVPELYCIAADLNLKSPRLKRTARNAEQEVKIKSFDTASQAITTLKEDHPDSQLIALEITSDSKPLGEFRIESADHISLILGSEVQGISEELLAEVQDSFHIEMFGRNSSMNVTQAAAIALYSIVQQLL